MSSGPNPDARVANARPRGLPPWHAGTLACALLVALAACGLLAAHAPMFEAQRLHIVSPFADQAAHITTARHLADTGELRSGLLYPAFIRNPAWHPYMPGHHLLLAASYRVLGWGTLATLLPNLVCYVLSAVAVFLVGQRFYGRAVGWLAALLFALFPPSLNYAYTAMSETDLAAVCMLAFALFAGLPRRLQPWLMPLCLTPPFLFRETAALLVIPMFFVMVSGQGRRRQLLGLVSVVASVVLLIALNRWQTAQGKGFSALTWVTFGLFNYADALADMTPELSPGEWLAAFWGNARRNLSESAKQLTGDPWRIGVVGFGTLLLALAAAAVRGVRRREALCLGTALLGVGMLLVVYFLYDVKGQKALRSLLFISPLLFVCLAATGRALWTRFAPGHRAARAASVAGLLLGFGALQHALARETAREFLDGAEQVDASTAVLEELGHDDHKLIIVAFELFPLTLDYAVRHYPVRWAWMPGNEATTRMVLETYDLGTLVISPDAFPGGTPPRRSSVGDLVYRRDVELGGRRYFVYQPR